ncbi:MAG: peptide chain release factor N(5)-glutamine methyltransferase [Alphaproteobacteria bacterium]|nr:peptide chain release factor N(5)-glutamine methyltransferase [Alphaproteobacteria bacterium]
MYKAIDQRALEKIKCRQEQIPVERIFGVTDFCGIRLFVADGVFKPYSETENLVYHAILMLNKINGPVRVLDIGTGSGCILLAILHAVPQATGVGVDMDEKAINAARINAKANCLDDRAEFCIGNWSENIEEKFDLVISNPPRVATDDLPYLIPEMRNYDPIAALDGGKDGLLFFRLLGKDFHRLTKLNGFGLFQVGIKYAYKTCKIMRQFGIENSEIKFNHLGMPCAIAVVNQECGIISSVFKRLELICKSHRVGGGG